VKTLAMTMLTTLTVSTLGLSVGCNNERDRPAASPANDGYADTNTARVDDVDRVDEGTGKAPVGAASASAARDQITDARCAREQRCENVGDNKKYSSIDDCRATVRAEWKDELNNVECPQGVNEGELNECLGEIRGEDCGSPIDTLSRVAACTTGQICIG
jgi:hypothetical protein